MRAKLFKLFFFSSLSKWKTSTFNCRNADIKLHPEDWNSCKHKCSETQNTHPVMSPNFISNGRSPLPGAEVDHLQNLSQHHSRAEWISRDTSQQPSKQTAAKLRKGSHPVGSCTQETPLSLQRTYQNFWRIQAAAWMPHKLNSKEERKQNILPVQSTVSHGN